MERSYPCNLCRHSFPRSALVGTRVRSGFNGRLKSGWVLLCAVCLCSITEEYHRKNLLQITTFACLASLVFFIVIVLKYYFVVAD